MARNAAKSVPGLEEMPYATGNGEDAFDEKAKALSFTFSTPAFGCLSGNIGCAAEHIAIALQRLGNPVWLKGTPNSYGYYLGYQVPDEEYPNAPVVAWEDPAAWRKTQRPFPASALPLVGVVTHPVSPAPASWELGMHQADAVFCPSEWVMDTMDAATNGKKIILMRFGVDATVFFPKLRQRTEKFKFLFNARNAANPRKGTQIAIRAFLRAFPKNEDVELIIRSTVRHDIQRDDRRIRFMFNPVTPGGPGSLAELYHTHDVLIYPSQGESFPHVAIEAMATGMPVLHTGKTGMSEVKEIGMIVDSRPTTNGWHEPLEDPLIHQLLYAYHNYELVAKKAYEDAPRIASRFSWDDAARCLIQNIPQ